MTEKRLLEDVDLFQGLSAIQLDRVRQLCQLEDYEPGTAVIGEKAAAGKLYVVDRGRVALQVQLPSGGDVPAKRVTVDTVTKGEVFGWSAVVGRQPYTLTAVCLEPTTVAGISGPGLRALMQEDNTLGYLVLRGLIEVVASRLDETRQLLITERLVSS